MVRIDFHFPEELLKSLRNLSKETGAPVAELLRRAATEYLEKRKQKNEKEKN